MIHHVPQVHHPIANSLYYEDQKDEALRCAESFRKERVPKFFKLFELALQSNSEGAGKYLVGSSLTVADLYLLQSFDGVCFGFPRLIGALKETGKYDTLFSWRQGLDTEGKLGEYLKSGRRRSFSDGLFRHYPELDGEEVP
jgi:glutathione S-transferase